MSFETLIATTSAMAISYINVSWRGYTNLLYTGWPILVAILVLSLIIGIFIKFIRFK